MTPTFPTDMAQTGPEASLRNTGVTSVEGGGMDPTAQRAWFLYTLGNPSGG
jgi:hypothetical protein